MLLLTRRDVRRDRHFRESAKPLFPIYSSPEDSFNYTIWEGLQWSVLGVVPRPSGLAITAGVVYVGSHALGQVFALDRATGAVLLLARLRCLLPALNGPRHCTARASTVAVGALGRRCLLLLRHEALELVQHPAVEEVAIPPVA